MNTNLTLALVIERSTHPEFDLFASMIINGRQIARRGNRDEIATFVREAQAAAARVNVTLDIVDNSAA